MARRKGKGIGGGGSGGKKPGNPHLYVAQPPAATPPTPERSLPIVAKRTSASTAVVLLKKTDTALVRADEPFRLLVEAMGPDSPNVRVSWCISRATVAELRDKHKVPADSARMLLLVTRELGGLLVEVERHLLALDTPVHYMRFEQPGRHHIHGFIVWSNLENKSKAHAQLFNLYMDAKADGYINCLTDGMTARIAAKVLTLDHVAEHTVDVPREFFAKKPSWERFPQVAEFFWWFTNLWFEKGPVDQCAFGKRWMFGTLPKIVAVPLYCIYQSVVCSSYTLLLLLLGRRPSYMKFKPIWHPFDYGIEHLVDAPNHRVFEARAYIWLTDSKGYMYDGMMLPIRIPLVWIGAAIGAYYINQNWPDGEFGGGTLSLTPMLVLGAVVAWMFIFLAIAVVVDLQNRSIVNEPARRTEAERRAEAKRLAEFEAAAKQLAKQKAAREAYYTELVESGPVCDSSDAPRGPPTVWQLSWAKLSIGLIYDHAKAKRCKNYAK